MKQANRLELQSLLEGITPNVYFQRPSNDRMKYPCIVYTRAKINTRFANNNPYNHDTNYTVTVIDFDPDSDIVAQVAALPQCTHDRQFQNDQLNHDVFSIAFK